MTFFTGDFNGHSQIWYSDGDSTPEGEEIENLLSSLGLHQVIKEPTNYEPNKKATCIDLIISDQPNLILDSGTRPSPDPTCHHQITYCKSNFNLPPPPVYERLIWHYDRANTDLLRRAMAYFPWQQYLNLNPDPNWQAKEFTKIFLNIMSNFIPHEIKKIHPRESPWITKPLKSMIRKKNRLYKNYKKHGFQENDKVRLDTFRLECQKATEYAKNEYLTNLGNKLQRPHASGKIYWKILNKAMNRSKAPKIPPVLFGNNFITNCKEKAILFTDFFCKQCTPVVTDSILPALIYKTDNRIDHFAITTNDILPLISKINPNKATGSDGISGQMLILCSDSVALPLNIIFRNILFTGIYPSIWKLANITPIHKKGDKQLIKNYRPISLIPLCGKIFEKIVFNHLYSYLTTNNLITKKQSGFRPGDSTTNQLLDLIDTIHQSFDALPTLEVRAVFMDISKAFDKVWHEGLIFKLKQNGISGSLLNFLKNYLSNRKQRVVLNGSCADYKDIESGVPQGSVLGPLLFLVYINDLESNIKSQIRFFADDTMLFSVVKNPAISANELNHDLEVITHWAHQWKLEFNPDPTKQATVVLFSQKVNPVDHPPLYFNGSIVTKVEKQKHLGLILDSKLSFRSHINEKFTKTKKIIGMIKHLSKYLPINTLKIMYKSLIRPHLDYCSVIFHIPPSNNGTFDSSNCHIHNISPLNVHMNKIESVQYQAARAITGTWQGTSRDKLYKELGFESLSDRRSLYRLIQLFKIKHNITPEYLNSKLPPLSITNDPTANPKSFNEIIARTQRYKNTFFPNAITTWNNIIANIQGIITINQFKNIILKFIRPNDKPFYGIHDPIGLHYLFQMRTELSPLKSHKHRHKFRDTPTDICNCLEGIEDNKHFLLDCLQFIIQRQIMTINVMNILFRNNIVELANEVDFYLYGDPRLSTTDNKAVLSSTIHFIKSTERFSQ